eukprot:snap_masked-scaffold_6-processed-gene-11.19-mRNA-1 protein AED:1.00 eAED:1.00 QI:0/0/0/0/1/1/2/0/90
MYFLHCGGMYLGYEYLAFSLHYDCLIPPLFFLLSASQLRFLSSEDERAYGFYLCIFLQDVVARFTEGTILHPNPLLLEYCFYRKYLVARQ